MKPTMTKLFHSIASAAVIVGATAPAQADDTEIFFGAPAGNGVIENVLFILDTSGSMASTQWVVEDYDPNTDYDGDLSDDEIGVFDSDNKLLGTILASKTTCQTMIDRLAVTGEYVGAQLASYRTKNKFWGALAFKSKHDYVEKRMTECADDRTVHGRDAASGLKMAADGKQLSDPWTSNVSLEFNWADITSRTVRSANYVNWYDNYRNVSVKKSRIDIMKGVLSRLINSSSGMNIGLMSFNNTVDQGTSGSHIDFPMGYIEDVRSNFLSEVNALNATGATPLAESLFEGLRYYQGGTVFQGNNKASDGNPANHSGSYSNGKYISPIVSECQPNKVVLLTDGEPTFDANLVESYSYFPDRYKENDVWARNKIKSVVGNCSGNCLDEIADYMNNHDLNSNHQNSDTQGVQTYTIGFHTQQSLLQKTATKGGGQYFEASDTATLETALQEIINDAKDTRTTFVTPGVAVNTFNRLNHRDELYFAVFKPLSNPQWQGNLKRYKLGSDGIVYDNSSPAAPAIDSKTGFFRSDDHDDGPAKSWWSSQPDGDDINEGGAAENLPDDVDLRRVYTRTGSSKDLTDKDNQIVIDNSLITKAMLGHSGASDAERTQLINWIRGMDVLDINENDDTTDAHKQVLDPLHSPPLVVIYGGTDSNPDTTIFYGDNQGFLHAVNGSDGSGASYSKNPGEEYFAFMPDELLANQRELFENSPGSPHPYGMDGAIAAWVHDDNNDRQISTSGNDFVYIYSGMRRGGRNYYALDATDRDKPKFLWEIIGGSGGTSGFEELGQTWSKPVKTKVKTGSTVHDVLIFAGGYDPDQDSAKSRSPDEMGRAVYIVNAETGSLLWSATYSDYSDMKYSIPSNVKAIDVNADGISDQFYVGDMGGQVWRFDIDNENSSGNKLSVYGGVIADLAGNDSTSNRRFYHAPDVSAMLDGGTPKLAIAIGSGWQAHPLDTNIVDRFFLLTDTNVHERPKDSNGDPLYIKLTEENLYDATDNHLGHVSGVNTLDQQKEAYRLLGESDGWYITLERAGEKVLATSLTVGGEVYFTTYEPKPVAVGCGVSGAGIPRLFHIQLSNATPVVNYDGIGLDTELTRPDREVKLKTTSLPTSPQRLRIDGKDIIIVGTETMDPKETAAVVRTYWVEQE